MSEYRERFAGASDAAVQTLRDLAGEDVWDRLVGQSHERWHPPGQTLMRQGEPGDLVVAVLSGVAKVVRTDRGGQRLLLAFRGPGELLGEVAVRDGGGRLVTVETLSRCKVAVMGKAEFTQFVAVHDLTPVLERYALNRLRQSTQARGGGEVRTRLAATLVRIADLTGPHGSLPSQPLELSLTREELAEHLQVSRNTVSRKLSELEFCQVSAGRTRIVIGDLGALRQVAEAAG
ncbi:Transcriptional regulator [Streptomyces albus]|uniref:Transcriptional regulator n=1 Tax=Streptomyces albus (strain ATCC 21838 / DSM 41398 / FERM P-419 / JCM 4703 / NBRC 107858) TaxID=1081613 RepID=A0A0B5ERJ1_STRA4|nr:Transcriptional regulator [Streptomyces albus]AOU78561.1 Transcriptional regulator [Streptomyces albus]AYN34305.1 Transcriptional regulator [Streptomyces albus]